MKTIIKTPVHTFEIQINSKEMKTVSKLFSNAIPDFLRDRVGILNDTAKLDRLKNFIKISLKAKEELKDYDVEIKPLPLKETIQFSEAASLETDETLQDLYSKLLASSLIDSTNASIFISIIKELTPNDAKVIQYYYKVISKYKYADSYEAYILNIRNDVFNGNDEATYLSIDNLLRQRIVTYLKYRKPDAYNPPVQGFVEAPLSIAFTTYSQYEDKKALDVTPLGKAFILACNEVISNK
jgi:hypothetical protein